MKDTDLIYRIKQALVRSEEELPPHAARFLSEARAKAVKAARARNESGRRTFGARLFGSRPSFWHIDRNWAIGASVFSLALLVISLSVVREASIDRDIERLAEIDRKVITSKIPVQAYLDPGFQVFQEIQIPEAQSSTQSPSQNESLTHRAESALKEFWSLQALFPGLAQTEGPTWSKLTTAQREALAPLEASWPEMNYNRKRKWLKIADTFPQMPAEEQKLAQARMQEWVSLPASERRQARAAFGGVEEKSIPQDVQAIKWNEYQRLSPKERARLMELAQERIKESGQEPSRSGSALAPQSAKPLAPAGQ